MRTALSRGLVGGAIPVAPGTEGKKDNRCLYHNRTGWCSKGKACDFQHEGKQGAGLKVAAAAKAAVTTAAENTTMEKAKPKGSLLRPIGYEVPCRL